MRVSVCVCVCVCGLPGKVLPLMGTDGHATDDKTETRQQTHAHYTHTNTHSLTHTHTRLSNLDFYYFSIQIVFNTIITQTLTD